MGAANGNDSFRLPPWRASSTPTAPAVTALRGLTTSAAGEDCDAGVSTAALDFAASAAAASAAARAGAGNSLLAAAGADALVSLFGGGAGLFCTAGTVTGSGL